MIKFVSNLQHVGGFLWVLWFSSPIILKYVESGAKHHNPSPSILSHWVRNGLEPRAIVKVFFYLVLQEDVSW